MNPLCNDFEKVVLDIVEQNPVELQLNWVSFSSRLYSVLHKSCAPFVWLLWRSCDFKLSRFVHNCME